MSRCNYFNFELVLIPPFYGSNPIVVNKISPDNAINSLNPFSQVVPRLKAILSNYPGYYVKSFKVSIEYGSSSSSSLTQDS